MKMKQKIGTDNLSTPEGSAPSNHTTPTLPISTNYPKTNSQLRLTKNLKNSILSLLHPRGVITSVHNMLRKTAKMMTLMMFKSKRKIRRKMIFN